MNKEFLQMLCICISPLLFSIGGMFLKAIRRFLLPIFLAICLILGGVEAWRAITAMICLSVALCLPYGEKTAWWLKFVVFCLYFASFSWIGFSVWQIISPVIIFGLFKISNTKWGKNIVFWRVFEGIAGLLCGITAASLM